MENLPSIFPSVLAERYKVHAKRIHELAAALTEAQFWRKPFPFGNSFGHLVLHLTGNLSYYIGTQIAGTGYVRDRPKEFSDSNPPSKTKALNSFDDAVGIAVRTIQNQSPEDWSAEYSGEGTGATNRMAIFLICESHIEHHLGQMIYLVSELERLEPR